MARNVEFSEEAAVQKAMEVFRRKGYSGASLRDLTDAMQINSSSLYNTIGDKRELFVRCIRSYTKASREEALLHKANHTSPLQGVISFIDAAINNIASNNNCMVIKMTFEIAGTDPDVKALLRQANEFAHTFLLQLIKEAIAQNELRQDLDAETATNCIINAFTGWHESYILHQDTERIQKMAHYLIAQLTP